MAQDIRYNVIAQMSARGWAGMKGMARSFKPVYANIAAIESKLSGMGAALKGSMGQAAATWGARGAMAGAVALPAAMGAAAASGLAFNKTMENSTLQAATMYQLFDMGAKAAEVASGEMSQWKYNLQASKAVFKELYDIAEKTPGSFQDVSKMYKSTAAGLTTATKDLGQHMAFMKKAALLGGLADGDYQVAGAQFGRIMGGSAGAELVVWQNLKTEILKAGVALGTFKKGQKADDTLTQKFNQLEGAKRYELVMKAMSKIGPDVADAWGESMDGVLGTSKSVLDQFKGRLTKPLYEGLRKGLMGSNTNGALGKANLDRWNHFADQAGQKLARAGMYLFGLAEQAATFIRDNWLDIMVYGKNVGIAIGGLIKAAFAWGLARWIAGTAFLAGGKIAGAVSFAKNLAAKLKPVFERQARMTHAAIVRGAHGKRGGVLGRLGGLLGARTNRMARDHRTSSTFQDRYKRGKDGKFAGGKNGGGMITRLSGALGSDPFRNIAKGIAKFASLGVVLAGGAVAVAGLIVAFGILFTIVGGIAAYVVSNWEAIRMSLVTGLRDGSVALTPVIAAAYSLWERLKMVGVWLLGSSDHGKQFATVLGWATWAFNSASGAIGFFLQSMSFFMAIWWTLKMGMLGLMRVIVGIIDLLAEIPGVGDTFTQAQINAGKNYEAFSQGIDETASAGSELAAMADRIDKFQLSAMQMEQVQSDADAVAASIAKSLEGMGKSESGKKTAGAKVHVDKIDMKIDLRDEDPDRMMSMFLTPLMRLGEHRTQSGMLPAGGV
jgi:hypothetical protein